MDTRKIVVGGALAALFALGCAPSWSAAQAGPVDSTAGIEREQCDGSEMFKLDETDARGYYQCNIALGRWELHYCGDGLWWSPEGNRCDWPENSGQTPS
ncbi:hypothetical protein Snoj_82100 [Streptomyces nojiriensis]|uniref:Chitin-binding type-2 domain-containing protein n=1 Tax=Streptomyces nojiriensis TaxID=66374 RepID=A0ABQ3T1M2_9ACTN|nr:hypothetical protein GCM10010205_00220 [Streptomyces nojiriensis]GHI74292.1 hypothetical protein Snoj_82100 [Streptomyces nojiriensis]